MSDKKKNKLEAEYKKCQEEREEYLNGWKRSAADLINYKKEEAQKLASALETRTIFLIKDLLVIVDSFERALESREIKDPVGFGMIYDQLKKFLKDNDVSPIKARAGDEFDPNLHEALGEVGEVEEGKIAEILMNGYKYKEKVLRCTKVKVGKINK